MVVDMMQIGLGPTSLHHLGGAPSAVQGDTTEATRQGTKKRTKRVGKACESCRQKRLKCTDNAQPCMNCQLYDKECVYSTAPIVRGAPRARQRQTAKAHRPSVSESLSSGQLDSPGREASTRTEQRGVDKLPAPALDIYSGARIDSNDFASTQQNFDATLLQSTTMPDSPSFDLGFTPGMGFGDLSNMTDLLQDRAFTPYTPAPVLHRPASVPFVHLSPVEPNVVSREEHSAQRDASSGARVIGLDYFKLPSMPDSAEAAPAGLMVWKNAVDNKFIGPTSTGAIISSCLKQSIESFQKVKESHALDYLTEAVEHVDELRWPPNAEPCEYWLPEQRLASSFKDVYFQKVHILYPILDPTHFEKEWLQLYDRTGRSTDPIFVSLFYLIAAIGALSDANGPVSNAQNEARSRDLYQRAWKMLPAAISHPYTSSVQVLLLHVIYMFHYSKSGIAWVLCGFALRIAQSLGLHRSDEGDTELDSTTRQLRCRIWWTCYILDAFLSAIQGRPPAVNDSTCNLASLSQLAPSSFLDAMPALASDVFFWHVGLARIKNRFCHLFSAQTAAGSLADQVCDLDAALIGWRDNLPLEYRPEQAILAPREFYPFIAMLHLQYFNLMSSLHWSMTVSAQRGLVALNEHSNPRIRASEAISVSSARAFVKVLNDVSDELGEEKLPSICLHTDHYMAGISVIFANIFQHPKKMSARTDFEFLRAGHHHFERHVNPLRFNKRLRDLFQNMLEAAEELLNSSGQHVSP